jgi:hypothetical protein
MSELRTASVADLVGTGPVDLVGQSAAKAYNCYNGSTPVSRASFNVSSLVDNGAGDFTSNFTASFVNDDFTSANSTGSTSSVNNYATCEHTSGRTTGAVRVQTWNGSALYDLSLNSTNLHGDLA